jgi:hypothetical protein
MKSQVKAYNTLLNNINNSIINRPVVIYIEVEPTLTNRDRLTLPEDETSVLYAVVPPRVDYVIDNSTVPATIYHTLTKQYYTPLSR